MEDFIEMGRTYDVLGSTITYKQLKNGTIVAIRGKGGKEIFRITQKELKETKLGGLLGIAQRYEGLKYKSLYGLTQIVSQRIDGLWIIK